MKSKFTHSLAQYDLPVVIEPQEEGGYLARSTSWSDCYAQGKTVNEALSEIYYVAKSLMEVYQEEGMKIPLRKKYSQLDSLIKIDFSLFASA